MHRLGATAALSVLLLPLLCVAQPPNGGCPPPSGVSACASLAIGDACSFTTPHGTEVGCCEAPPPDCSDNVSARVSPAKRGCLWPPQPRQQRAPASSASRKQTTQMAQRPRARVRHSAASPRPIAGAPERLATHGFRAGLRHLRWFMSCGTTARQCRNAPVPRPSCPCAVASHGASPTLHRHACCSTAGRRPRRAATQAAAMTGAGAMAAMAATTAPRQSKVTHAHRVRRVTPARSPVPTAERSAARATLWTGAR